MADGNKTSHEAAPKSAIPTIHVPISKLEGRTTPVEPSPALPPDLEARLQAELDTFIAEEKLRLGLADAPAAFQDVVQDKFVAAERAHTTILVSGLTYAHDSFVTAALRGLGYRVQALDCPDNDALRVGKEFGNRGQCNPTYFTVGNLVKTLQQMEAAGMSKADIESNYVYLTAGACGPCRFGSYTTEYRKALRDAGFERFRVTLVQQKGGLDQSGAAGEAGLDMNVSFTIRVVLALMVGDVLNALMYRIRPYEVEPGATNAALEKCRALIVHTLETPGQAWRMPYTLVQVRRLLAGVAVDRTRIKPKVGIIGEFWAMTTEGDGNYKMPAFLEQEGAEVDVQLVSAWLLYNLWEVRWDTQRRIGLKGTDGGRYGLTENLTPHKTVWTMHAADKGLRVVFHAIGKTMGLHGYVLPDMDELAKVVDGLYHHEVRGGEGHMEVAKLLLNHLGRKVGMTLSIKPFGCMPSSGVSDGVQTVVQAQHPDALYLAVETTGDGAVNVQSRVQMVLHKARQQAQREVDKACADAGVTLDEVKAFVASPVGKVMGLGRTLRKPNHVWASTAGDAVVDAARWMTVGRKVRGMVPGMV